MAPVLLARTLGVVYPARRVSVGRFQGSGWRSSTVEHRFCKPGVRGSSPRASSTRTPDLLKYLSSLPNLAGQREPEVVRAFDFGGLPEWPKGADCKSAGYAFDGSNPSPSTGSKLGQEENVAGVAQLVERQPSKLNVAGSNPVSRSR